MLKLILAVLTFGTMSSQASECRIHLSPMEMGKDWPSMGVLSSKISRQMKRMGAFIVQEPYQANVGLQLRYSLKGQTFTQNNGPYGNSKFTDYEYIVQVSEYRNGRVIKRIKYATTNASYLASQILKDINCL